MPDSFLSDQPISRTRAISWVLWGATGLLYVLGIVSAFFVSHAVTFHITGAAVIVSALALRWNVRSYACRLQARIARMEQRISPPDDARTLGLVR